MSKANTPQKKDGMLPIIICIIAATAIVLAVAVVMIVDLASIPDAPAKETSTTTATGSTPSTPAADKLMTEVKAEIDAKKVTDFEEAEKMTEYVKISVKDHGDIIIRLREDVAPLTVKNFQDLVSKKFYDNLTFHRIIKDFMIQGGDPKGDGTGNSDETIKGEFSANGVQNNLGHIKGVISMARRSSPMDSASCQFFICNSSGARVTGLDGQYAAFGYVVAGLSVVDSITNVSTGANDRPDTPVVIESVRFVTFK